MKSNLAEHFSKVRRRKDITLAQLARMMGYRNISKGCRRIDRFEKFGDICEELLVKLAVALTIDQQTVARLLDEDRQRYFREWDQWAATPIRPSIVFGHIGGIGWSELLPKDITREEAEQYASAVAKEKNRPICLVLSRRLSILFDADGNRTSVSETKPGEINLPYIRFGRRKVMLDLEAGTMQPLNDPQKPGPVQVVTDFGGTRLRSSFQITESKPGELTINIDGPFFEFDDDAPQPEGE